MDEEHKKKVVDFWLRDSVTKPSPCSKDVLKKRKRGSKRKKPEYEPVARRFQDDATSLLYQRFLEEYPDLQAFVGLRSFHKLKPYEVRDINQVSNHCQLYPIVTSARSHTLGE